FWGNFRLLISDLRAWARLRAGRAGREYSIPGTGYVGMSGKMRNGSCLGGFRYKPRASGALLGEGEPAVAPRWRIAARYGFFTALRFTSTALLRRRERSTTAQATRVSVLGSGMGV